MPVLSQGQFCGSALLDDPPELLNSPLPLALLLFMDWRSHTRRDHLPQKVQKANGR